jgi:DNA-binding response OmpR family regulator
MSNTSKRILIVHNDRLLSNLYREKLEGSGFHVETVRTFDSANKQVEAGKTDMVLMDLVLEEGQSLDLIKTLRVQSAATALPILIFPTNLKQLGAAAVHAGASSVIPRGANPVAGTLDAVKVGFGLPGLGDRLNAPLFQPDESWLETVLAEAPDNVNRMRHCVPGLVSNPPDFRALHGLWALAHSFAEKTALLREKALSRVASALDCLLQELNETPEGINPSTVRTVGQAIDFLALLSVPDNLSRTQDTSSSRVLAVDDEEGARQMIAAAMQFGGLACGAAGSPSAALEQLGKQRTDLIFLDVGMPEMNGFDVCAKIRAIEAHKKTPIVFLTGMATFQNKAQASLSGGTDFIGKPFTLPELALKALLWIYRHQLGMV